MHKLLLVSSLAIVSPTTMSATSIMVKDNSDIAVTLSQGNYNRLLIKNDKIIEAVFPPNAMGIKRDEQDGSVYIMLAANNPFTLFLTTEGGRHFSVTLNGEDSLGKTIELVPNQAIAVKPNAAKNSTPDNKVPNSLVSIITHMERHEPIQGLKISYQYGKAERLQDGVTLLPKEYWNGESLKGEIIEIYNGSQKTLNLSEAWFANKEVKAIKFSKTILAPKEHAFLYRVKEVAHG